MKLENMSGQEAWLAHYKSESPPESWPQCRQAFLAGVHHAIQYVRSCQEDDFEYQPWQRDYE